MHRSEDQLANLQVKESRRQRESMTQGVLVLLAIALLAGAMGWWLGNRYMARGVIDAPPGEVMLKLGEQRLDLQLPDVSGVSRRLSEWDGKPILLNFWASWCGPCMEEMPDLQNLATTQSKVQIIGIAVDEPGAARQAAKAMKITFPILIDNNVGYDSSNQFGNSAGVIPYSVLIDANGKLIDSHRGRMTRADLESWLKLLQ